MKNKRKLSIIKYNKEIMNKLEITKEDYKANLLLKEFNNKYKTNIEDIDIPELDLSKTNLGNQRLKALSKIIFKGLNILNLNDNEISDINMLSVFNLPDLKELDLSDNKISDITILEKVNFKNLKYYI